MKEPYFFMNHKGGETTVESANPRGGGGEQLIFSQSFFPEYYMKIGPRKGAHVLNAPRVRHYVVKDITVVYVRTSPTSRLPRSVFCLNRTNFNEHSLMNIK